MGGDGISRQVSLLDGVAVICGAGIAANHVRLGYPGPRGGTEWTLVAALFGWLTLTATGPFLYLARRLVPPAATPFPLVGDRLWALWGSPWVLSAVVESMLRPRPATPGRLEPAYVGCLGLGLFLATAIAVPVVAARYLWGEPGGAGRRAPRASWTQWVGLTLSATWPIQCGVGLLMME